MTENRAESADEEQQIVVNRCFGGFGLSDEALDMLVEEHGYTTTTYEDGEYADPDADIIDDDTRVMYHYSLIDTRKASTRTRSELVEVVHQLGEDANGQHANLEVVELPAAKEWVVTEYDGVETVREKHRKYPGGDYETGVFSSDDL